MSLFEKTLHLIYVHAFNCLCVLWARLMDTKRTSSGNQIVFRRRPSLGPMPETGSRQRGLPEHMVQALSQVSAPSQFCVIMCIYVVFRLVTNICVIAFDFRLTNILNIRVSEYNQNIKRLLPFTFQTLLVLQNLAVP